MYGSVRSPNNRKHKAKEQQFENKAGVPITLGLDDQDHQMAAWTRIMDIVN
jgi:hypothetical protein